MKSFRFIDLFCGIGGFHQAMTALGGKCVYACDIDEDCRKTYFDNYGIYPDSDITKVDPSTIPPFEVLCAGFPCQAFSKAGKRLGFSDETKGTLFFDIERIMSHCKPEYALLENVRNLASHDHGNTWKTIYEHLTNVGYNVLPKPVIFSPHYLGIPQHRERVFIMCVRKDIGSIPEFVFDSKKAPKCCIDKILQDDSEIMDLEKRRLSEDRIHLLDIWNEFLQGIKCKKLPGFPIWSEYLCELNPLEDLDQYPKWKQNFIRKNNELYLSNKEFIDDWLPRAKSNPLFFGAKAKLEWQAGQTKKPNLWDNILQFRPSGIRIKPGTYFPALVAITQTSVLGSRKRELTLRECARLQSFPDSFKPDCIDAQAYKQFGNAVNVELVKLFAKYMFGDAATLNKYSMEKNIKSVSIKRIREDYPNTIVDNDNNTTHELSYSKNLLISYVKNDNVDRFLDGSASIYYTGRKFPATVALNKLYYFMPYIKGKGIKDLYLIRIARVGTRKEGQPDNNPNDFRLVFEIEFIKHLFEDYKPIRLEIWDIFTDTTLEKISVL